MDDRLAALHLDTAVWSFGSQLDEAIREATEPEKRGKKSKPLTAAQRYHRTMTVLEKWLGVKGLKKYKDPAQARKR